MSSVEIYGKIDTDLTPHPTGAPVKYIITLPHGLSSKDVYCEYERSPQYIYSWYASRIPVTVYLNGNRRSDTTAIAYDWDNTQIETASFSYDSVYDVTRVLFGGPYLISNAQNGSETINDWVFGCEVVYNLYGSEHDGNEYARAYFDSQASPPIYVGVNGKARQVTDMYVGVNGKARKVKAIYVGVNGKARKVF